MVLESRSRLPVAPPLPELREAGFAVVPEQRVEGRVRKPGRVQHHLLDGDDVLAFGTELGDVLRDAARHVDPSGSDESPHRARDDRLGGREDHVARVGRRVTERHRRGDASFTCECELTRREQAGIDLGAGPRRRARPRPLRRSRARSRRRRAWHRRWSRGGAYKRTASILQTRRRGAACANRKVSWVSTRRPISP